MAKTQAAWRTEQNYIDNPMRKPGVAKKHGQSRLGKPLSETTKEAMRGLRPHCGGANCHLWKGGVSKDIAHKKRIKNEWRINNKDRDKLYKQRRKALMRGGGDLSIKTIQEVYEHNIKEFGTLTCVYCFNPISFGKDRLEHITPLSKNGDNKRDNLAIACAWCNGSKWNKLLSEWIGGCHR